MVVLAKRDTNSRIVPAGIDDPTDQPNDDVMMRLIERGQREGSFAPELSATWIEHSLFGLLLKGCEDAGSGEFPRHTVAPLIIRTFERGICPLH